MFCELEISNFKCFTKEKVRFKNLTILAGANASGKSSIIQSLLLIKESSKFKKEEENILQDLGGVLGIQIGGPRSLVSQNPHGDSAYDFEFCLDKGHFGYSIERNAILNLKSTVWGEFPEYDLTYLNAERIGPRMFYEAGGIEKMRPNGSNAAYLMEQGDRNELQIPELLVCDETSRKFSYQVECWMQTILGELQMHIKVDNIKAQSEVTIGNVMAQEPVIPTLTGFGISYVLPIVVAGLWCSSKEHSVLVVENPEAHLHPAAQSAMGQFLALVAAAGVQVIVETHSEHVIDGARIEMMYLNSTEKMLVNFLKNEEDKVRIEALEVDEKGNLDEWPDGFFDQKQIDLRTIFQMRIKNGDSQ